MWFSASSTYGSKSTKLERVSLWLESAYPGEGRNGWEVLQRGELADVKTDHLEQGELLQVGFVFRRQALDGNLV